MSVSAKIIKGKINSVKNIGKITRAMELVSAAKMRPAVDRTASSREYATRALEIMENLARHKVLKHPLLKKGEGKKTLVIMVASDKGLCGSYNANVLRTFTSLVSHHGEHGVSLIPVGKYANRVSRMSRVSMIREPFHNDKNIGWNDAKVIADLFMKEFLTGEYKQGLLIYTRYESSLSYKPVIETLLPVNTEAVADFHKTIGDKHVRTKQFEKESMDEYLFEPSEEELLNTVLPRLVESQVYQAVLEARASEHSARMFAMKNASDNAKEFIEDLTSSYNQARQSAITREISEIASGADAL